MTTETSNTHAHHLPDQSRPGGHHERSFTIVVRTLAGHRLTMEVIATEIVAAVTKQAVVEFSERHELEKGHYALSLPRRGHTTALDPAATLHDAGVRDGDELVLISRAPHVDG